MALVNLNLEIAPVELSRDVRAFLREADRRIEVFQRECHVPGFVPSDFPRAYALLTALTVGPVTPGNLFCEWGSGFGVVACLAAMLDFDASGIEINAGAVLVTYHGGEEARVRRKKRERKR